MRPPEAKIGVEADETAAAAAVPESESEVVASHLALSDDV
jgi:hypothetical protein